MMKKIIIESGHNTSWLSSFIIALFYRSSHLDHLLNVYPSSNKMIYVQEFIKHQYIHLMKNRYSIFGDTINKLRNYINFCKSASIEDWIEENEIHLFYQYFIDNIDSKYVLTFLKDEIKETKHYISVEITDDDDNEINLTNKVLLFLKENDIQLCEGEIPMLVPIYIKRSGNKNKVEIMSKIKLCENEKAYWKIFSIICRDDKGYYTVICEKDKMYIFNDRLVPSNIECEPDDDSFTDKFAEEVEMVFYVLNV